MNATIHENVEDMARGKNQSKFRQIMRQLRSLFCDVRQCFKEFKLMALFLCIVNIYYFGLYNSSQLEGNPIVITILFSVAEVGGIVIGERIVHSLGNTRLVMVVTLIVIFVCSCMIKLVPMSNVGLMATFLVQIFFIGNSFNLCLTVQDEETPAKLSAVSFELNYSFGTLTTLGCPIISKMPEPIPTIYVSTLCLLAIVVTISLCTAPAKAKINLADTIEQTMVSVMMTHDMGDRKHQSLTLDRRRVKQQITAKWKVGEGDSDD